MVLELGGNQMVENCVVCKGVLKAKAISHIVDMDGHIIIIKNVPAEVCNQCGESYLSHEVALKVEKLIDIYANNNVEVLIINFYDKVA